MLTFTQNAFPTLTKYIDHVHLENGKPLKVIEKLKNEVLINFNSMLALHKQGKKVFFAHIDKLKQMMLNELKEDLN